MGRLLCQVFTLVSIGLINQREDRSNRLPEPRRGEAWEREGRGWGGGGWGRNLHVLWRTRVQLTWGYTQSSYKRRDAGVFIHEMLLSNLSGGDPSCCYQEKKNKEWTWMRHPVAGGPLRQNCVSFKRVDRLTMERGQSRGGERWQNGEQRNYEACDRRGIEAKC